MASLSIAATSDLIIAFTKDDMYISILHRGFITVLKSLVGARMVNIVGKRNIKYVVNYSCILITKTYLL